MNIFVDYASVDANTPPDFNKMKIACTAAGSTLSGAIFRAAYGTLPDPTVQRDWIAAKRAGLTTGAYLFLRSRKDQPICDQVHCFADQVGTLDASDLVPTIDVEDTWPSAEAELEAVHTAWVEMRSIYGVPPMLYDSNRVWVEDLHNLPAGEMTASPQWVAKPWPWPIHTPAVLGPGPFSSGVYDPPVPKPWGAGNWWLHQYQGDAHPVPGFSNTVDLSRFHLMRPGETGVRVAWVQRRLRMAVTSVYDAQTESTVRAFQRAHNLVADAIIGPQTFPALLWLPAA